MFFGSVEGVCLTVCLEAVCSLSVWSTRRLSGLCVVGLSGGFCGTLIVVVIGMTFRWTMFGCSSACLLLFFFLAFFGPAEVDATRFFVWLFPHCYRIIALDMSPLYVCLVLPSDNIWSSWVFGLLSVEALLKGGREVSCRVGLLTAYSFCLNLLRFSCAR
jgi:hypothetical protein